MKKTLRRMICLLLAICMLPLGGLTAWAADVDTVEPEDTYVADGVTYYKVKTLVQTPSSLSMICFWRITAA